MSEQTLWDQPGATPDLPSGILTLQEARNYVRNGAKTKEGVICPCCSGYAKIYSRRLNEGMAIVLCYLFIEYYTTSEEYVQVKQFLLRHGYRNNHDWTLLRHWGLLEPKEHEDTDPENNHSNGYWKITGKGKEFVRDTRIRVPSHISIYQNKLLGFEGDPVNIKEALGKKFSYPELMNSMSHLIINENAL